MTNVERARRWIEDRDLGRATVESDVMSLAMQFDKVRDDEKADRALEVLKSIKIDDAPTDLEGYVRRWANEWHAARSRAIGGDGPDAYTRVIELCNEVVRLRVQVASMTDQLRANCIERCADETDGTPCKDCPYRVVAQDSKPLRPSK